MGCAEVRQAVENLWNAGFAMQSGGFHQKQCGKLCSTWNKVQPDLRSVFLIFGIRRKNGCETWQILSASARGTKTPQKANISPRISHQKSAFRSILQNP
jgi:hypothetical protein